MRKTVATVLTVTVTETTRHVVQRDTRRGLEVCEVSSAGTVGTAAVELGSLAIGPVVAPTTDQGVLLQVAAVLLVAGLRAAH